ncbi:hypothetical protein LZQ00_03265 [Sphingobacterium sp. SRCM116780]|uniref:hypothetical protein n=1 Tax=Sphingobacterium sp. SRCM116780 TaxID=2907623 RepID=UPI001F401C8C|nr:hypothetical protein [Sphingobacterium sp. SRCM116780]UIR56845.1 hypothetical protein LZQ00_03265 [Sphingobacterium sp. SRCM116780]
MKKYLLYYLSAFLLFSCKQKNEKNQAILDKTVSEKSSSVHVSRADTENLITHKQEEVQNNHQQNGKAWLENIFTCNNKKNKFCFYLEDEEKLCTKRFYQFMIDSEEIFGASNLTASEYPDAVKKYQQKWTNIYPLRTDSIGETWLFGRSNDDMENIQDVKIIPTADLKYDVFVDYGGGIKTENQVILVEENGHYKIDYCVTTFVK